MVQVKAGFWRLARYNGQEWPYFVFGSLGSGILGAIFPFFALVGTHFHKGMAIVCHTETQDFLCYIHSLEDT